MNSSLFSWKVLLAGALIAFLTALAANSTWFQAALLTDSGTSTGGTADLYISDNYTAVTEETGEIRIYSGVGLTDISALSFVLRYNPNQIHLSNEVILGAFSPQPEMVLVSPDNTRGEATIDIASSQSFSINATTTVAASDFLIDIPVTIQEGVTEGTQISIEFSEAQIIDSLYNITMPTTENGRITINPAPVSELKTLNAEAVSDHEIAVYFDEFLSDITGIAQNLYSLGASGNEINLENPRIASDNGRKLLFDTGALAIGSYTSSDTDARISVRSTGVAATTQIALDAASGVLTLPIGVALNLIGTENVKTLSEFRGTDTSGNSVLLPQDQVLTITNSNTATLSTGTTVTRYETLNSGTNITFITSPFASVNLGTLTTTVPASTEIADPAGSTMNRTVLNNAQVQTRFESQLNVDTTPVGGTTAVPAGTLITLPAGTLDHNNYLTGTGTYTLSADTSITYQDTSGGQQSAVLPASTVLDVSFQVQLLANTQVSYSETLSSALSLTLPEGTELAFNTSAGAVALDTIETSYNALRENTTYQLHFTSGPTGNGGLNLDTNHDDTFFAYSSQASNALSQAVVTSPTSVALTFASSPNTAFAENPTKYRVYNSNGNTLTISSVSLNGLVATLTMRSPFTSGDKYYVIAEGVLEDTKNKVQYFFADLTGETRILSLSPESLSADGGSITVTGKNMNEIQRVLLRDTELVITNQVSDSITLTVPESFSPDLYDLQFYTNAGQVIVKQDFLLISDAEAQLRVISEESYASPRRVPNDGKTPTTLWAFIEDPRGVGDVNKVTLDLREIGGRAVVPMIGVDEDGQPIIVDNKRWFFLETVVPETVETSEIAKEIRVTAEDPHGNKAYGTISLIVTKNIRSSEVPEILEAYAVPTVIRERENVGFYAYVQDLDGVSDIDTVTIDLGPIGLGPQLMVSAATLENTQNTQSQQTAQSPLVTSPNTNSFVSATQGAVSQQVSQGGGQAQGDEDIPQERTTQWYGIQNLSIPDTTPSGTYDISVIATDASGEEGRTTLSVNISTGNIPVIDEDRTELSPRSSIPNNGQEVFTLTTYVSDEDGIEDITLVTIDLQEIGGTVVEMNLQGDMKEGQKGGWFIAEGLSVPREVSRGVKNLDIYAYDKQGNEVSLEVDVKVTDEDEVGNSPVIESSRSYTTPAAIPADEETRVVLNVFVEKHDFEITQVMVDLANIAKYVGPFGATASDSANSCLGATERMVCLRPGIQEGTRGQWYTLSDVVALKTTASSMEPYRIRVTVTDEKGKTGDGYIFLNVGDGTLPTPQTGFPKVQMAISTSPETLEVLFSNPIDPQKVRIGAFKITDTVDVTETLAITEAVINADATVVTLTTHEQEAERIYTLFADAKMLGLKEAQYTDNHADFFGFDKREMPPQLVKITPKSSTLLEIIFSEGLRPSSVSSQGRDIEIFTHEQQPKRLKISHVEFQDDNQTLRVSTESQVPNKRYILRVRNIVSAAGVKVGGEDRPRQTAKKEYFGIHKTFTGFQGVSKEKKGIIESVDFDGNGKIDFTDFTIFSSVYGQSLENAFPQGSTSSGEGNQEGEYQPTPIQNQPNATVPATSSVAPQVTEPISQEDSSSNSSGSSSTVNPFGATLTQPSGTTQQNAQTNSTSPFSLIEN